MMTEEQIDAELKSLARRKAKLVRMSELRQEIAALEKGFLNGDNSRLALKLIGEEVCVHFNLEFGHILSSCREERFVWPRMVLFYLARELGPIPYNQIAKAFFRDHSGVIYGCQRIAERVSVDEGFAKDVAMLKDRCKIRLAERLGAGLSSHG